MKFEEKHLTTCSNLRKILLRCNLPEANGEEMIGFSQAFYFIMDLEKHIVEELEKAKATEQALISPLPSEPVKNGKVPKRKKSK